MTIRKRPVSVLQLPNQSGAKEVSAFMREMEKCISIDRPQLVVDCSAASSLDKEKIRLLLCCLEEAMKRNGDVKLVGIDMDAQGAQDLTGLNRLFESFDTTADAVDSFHQLPSHAMLDAPAPGTSTRAAGRALQGMPSSSAKIVNDQPAR
jgi:anti-sigma B factor antagonist